MIPNMFKPINVFLILVLTSRPETTAPTVTPIGIKCSKIYSFILRATGTSALASASSLC